MPLRSRNRKPSRGFSRAHLERLESRCLLASDLSLGNSPELIYYDYLDEDGQLTGGSVIADRSNPLQTLTEPEVVPSNNVAAMYEGAETIIDNGPTSNRIDLTFVGDGYTEAELPDYADQVAAVVEDFFAEEPLASYASYFNVHQVYVESNESGVDHDPSQGVLKDTALDMGYWCGGTERLLCVNLFKARTAANTAPDTDQILAIANSTKYGGAGYSSSNLGTLAGLNGSAVNLALHEFGHSFADLADEYWTNNNSYNGPELSAVNVSIQNSATMAANGTKWAAWLPESNVGTFTGGMYHATGINRPTDRSKMRSLGQPFEQVNSEQFILKMYETVSPIDAATPAGSYDQSQIFSVTPLRPVSHSLDIQWSLNGQPIPGATSDTFDPRSLASVSNVGPGTHSLSVQVRDNTPAVRNPTARDSLMTESRTWTLELTPHLADAFVFYNDSAFDGQNPASTPADDDAIAPGKSFLVPGQAASTANYTNYHHGINGIMLDLSFAPDTAAIGASDFDFRAGNSSDVSSWRKISQTANVSVRIGDGAFSSDRITITWPNGTIVGEWLQIEIKPTANTGLEESSFLYVGNAVGETFDSLNHAMVNGFDFARIRDNQTSNADSVSINSTLDINHDGRINATDLMLARDNVTFFTEALVPLTPPPAGQAFQILPALLTEHRLGVWRTTEAAADHPLENPTVNALACPANESATETRPQRHKSATSKRPLSEARTKAINPQPDITHALTASSE